MTADRFKQTVAPLRQTMYRIALRIMANEDDALDAIQDTLIGLWDNRSKLEATDNRDAYIIACLKNQCISALRKAKKTLQLDDITSTLPTQSPENEIEARDTTRLIRHIIATLPPTQRRVVELSLLAQCSNDEIEQITGLSRQNIRTHLSRGRNKIKELFTLHTTVK